MNNFTRLLKINLLSLLALPLFLLATLSKLISKALEKIFLILGLGVFSFVLILIFEFLKDPMEALDMVLIILLDLLVIGIFLSIIVGIASILSSVAFYAIKILIQVFDWIYSKLYLTYSSLMNTCDELYEEMTLGKSGILYRFACFMYSIMIGVNQGLIFLVYYAVVLSGVLSVAFIILFFQKVSARVDAAMGISLIQLLKLYSTVDRVFICVVTIVVIGSVVGILFLIGYEWREWGEEMRMISSNYQTYIEAINQEKEDASLLFKWMSDPQVLEYYEGHDNVHNLNLVMENFYEKQENITQCIIVSEDREIGYLQIYPLSLEDLEYYDVTRNVDFKK